MILQKSLENILKQDAKHFGVYIKHIETGEEAGINQHSLFQTASSFKVPILAKTFDEVEKGKINLHDRIQLREEDLVPGSGVFKEFTPGVEVTIHDLITMMIIVSDNMATDKVLKIVGIKNVQDFMTELHLDNIYIYHSCWELLCLCAGIQPQPYTADFYQEFKRKLDGEADPASVIFQDDIHNNVATPADMGRLLEMIATGELVSKQASKAMFTILTKQQFTQRIPKLLPPETIAGNKTGTIGSVVNDVGIINLPNNKGTIVIAIFSKNNKSEAEGSSQIAELSKVAFDWFMNK